MSYEMIAILMFSSMMLMLLTGQRVFGAIGFVAVIAALLLWGDRGGFDIAVFRRDEADEMVSAADPADVHLHGLRAVGKQDRRRSLQDVPCLDGAGCAAGWRLAPSGLMVLISAMNGLSVAGMAIGATIALPELLQRGYDKRMVTGVIQAGSSLGILVPPSVVLVLYAMIARQPVGQLWLAGVIPGLMMAAMFIIYICGALPHQPASGPGRCTPKSATCRAPKNCGCCAPGLLPMVIFAAMMVPFVNGWTILVESSAIGAMTAFVAAVLKGRMTREVFENSVRNTLGITCMFMWIILAALALARCSTGWARSRRSKACSPNS